MTTNPQTALAAAIYDALVTFNKTNHWPELRLAQVRQHLAEHVAGEVTLSLTGLPAAPAAVSLPLPDQTLRDRIAAPTDWIDGHPQLEAIAAAVWEQCGRSDSGSCVEDDPRNIAVAALAAAVPPPAARAAVLLEAADRLADLRAAEREWLPATGLHKGEQELHRLAAEAQQADTLPRRGDQFEAWLKRQRDSRPRSSHAWFMVDCVLDLYRLHADTGTPLGEHVCEARVVGDCDCLETPAVPGQPAATDTSEETGA